MRKGRISKASIVCLLTALAALAACTKQESKENWNNVKEGSKNTWQQAKKAFSEGTEDFKDSTK
jgi:outer membrane biogenesis lipoprotein LolB